MDHDQVSDYRQKSPDLPPGELRAASAECRAADGAPSLGGFGGALALFFDQLVSEVQLGESMGKVRAKQRLAGVARRVRGTPTEAEASRGGGGAPGQAGAIGGPHALAKGVAGRADTHA